MGVLRCYGRFLNATIPESAKHPKLLPRREHLTTLLIIEVHQRQIHSGVAHTLAQIREEYWIPQGRVEVRSVLSRCLLCRRMEGPSFRLPATKLIEAWKKGQKQLDLFWEVWQKEYLLSLRERLPLEHKQGRYHHLAEPEEGSIVIVTNETLL